MVLGRGQTVGDRADAAALILVLGVDQVVGLGPEDLDGLQAILGGPAQRVARGGHHGLVRLRFLVVAQADETGLTAVLPDGSGEGAVEFPGFPSVLTFEALAQGLQDRLQTRVHRGPVLTLDRELQRGPEEIGADLGLHTLHTIRCVA